MIVVIVNFIYSCVPFNNKVQSNVWNSAIRSNEAWAVGDWLVLEKD